MYDVKVYSLAAEGAKQITPHFKVREFACSDGSDVVFVAPSLVDILEAIRVHFGAAVHIHSGYRTVSFNASLPGSSKKSQHCNGLAADLHVDGHTHQEVYNYACQLLGDHGGVGLYSWGVHIDVRADKSRWKG